MKMNAHSKLNVTVGSYAVIASTAKTWFCVMSILFSSF